PVLAGQRALLPEDLIGDAHFHVVSFARKQQQRFVLGLPAEAGDGAIIAVVVMGSGDAQVIDIVVLGVGEQRGIIDVFHQSQTEGGRGNAEDEVIGGRSLGEAGLGKRTVAGIGATGNGEDGFHTAIGAVGIGIAVGVKEERE